MVERLGPAPEFSADYRMPTATGGRLDQVLDHVNRQMFGAAQRRLIDLLGHVAVNQLLAGGGVQAGRVPDPAVWESMVEPERVFDLLSHDGLAAERVVLFSPGIGVVPADVTQVTRRRADGPSRTRLAVGPAAFLLAGGGSLSLQHADGLFDGLGAVCSLIQRATGARVNVNVYLSLGGDSGLGPHWDEHDVLAVQLWGSKRWVIRAGSGAAPLRERLVARGLTSIEPVADDGVVWDQVVSPGDVLVVGRGYFHDVTPTDELSIHATFGLDFPIGLDLLDHHGLDPDGTEPFRHDARRSGEGWQAPTLGVDDETQRWDATLGAALAQLPPRPSAGFADLMGAFRADDLADWRYSWTASGASILHHRGDTPSIATGGRLIRVSPTLLGRFDTLCQASEGPVGRLVAEVEPEFSDAADAGRSVRIALCELALESLVDLHPPTSRRSFGSASVG
jgi:hypothetical protein